MPGDSSAECYHSILHVLLILISQITSNETACHIMLVAHISSVKSSVDSCSPEVITLQGSPTPHRLNIPKPFHIFTPSHGHEENKIQLWSTYTSQEGQMGRVKVENARQLLRPLATSCEANPKQGTNPHVSTNQLQGASSLLMQCFSGSNDGTPQQCIGKSKVTMNELIYKSVNSPLLNNVVNLQEFRKMQQSHFPVQTFSANFSMVLYHKFVMSLI